MFACRVFFQKLKRAGSNDLVVYTYDDKKVGSILEWCQRMGLMSPSAKFLIASHMKTRNAGDVELGTDSK